MGLLVVYFLVLFSALYTSLFSTYCQDQYVVGLANYHYEYLPTTSTQQRFRSFPNASTSFSPPSYTHQYCTALSIPIQFCTSLPIPLQSLHGPPNPSPIISRPSQSLSSHCTALPIGPWSPFPILQLSSHLASCLRVAGEPGVSQSEPSPPSRGVAEGWGGGEPAMPP